MAYRATAESGVADRRTADRGMADRGTADRAGRESAGRPRAWSRLAAAVSATLAVVILVATAVLATAAGLDIAGAAPLPGELAGSAPLAAPPIASPAAPRLGASHPFRLSVADAEVDGAVLRARIQFFWDDLQLAVMEHTSDMDFRLEENARVDSLVARYINEMLEIEVGGEAVAGVLEGRGVDEATLIDEVMWWYRLAYRLPAETERIAIRNRLLFNMFEDQRNVVHVKTRSGRERAYSFGWDKDSVTAPLN